MESKIKFTKKQPKIIIFSQTTPELAGTATVLIHGTCVIDWILKILALVLLIKLIF